MKKNKLFGMTLGILLSFILILSSCNVVTDEGENDIDQIVSNKDIESTEYNEDEGGIPKDAISYDISKNLDGSVIAYLYKTPNAGTYTLNIQGNGKMFYEVAPWNDKIEMIRKLIIGDEITEINDNAFLGMIRLEEVCVPNTVTRIGLGTFSGCISLKQLTLPFVGESASSNNTHIGYLFGAESYKDNSTFVPESLKKIIIENAETIGKYAFYNCQIIDEIVLPDTLKKIDSYAFYGIAVDSLTIPNSINEMGAAILEYAKINTLTIPFVGDRKDNPTQTSIGYLISGSSLNAGDGPDTIIVMQAETIPCETFYYLRSTKSIVINGTATQMEGIAFNGCKDLESVTINCPIQSLGRSAFQNCASLKSIILPATVTKMNERSFNLCPNLDYIYFCGTQNDWNSITKPTNWKENIGKGIVVCDYRV